MCFLLKIIDMLYGIKRQAIRLSIKLVRDIKVKGKNGKEKDF
jgi:hypothetical protein